MSPNASAAALFTGNSKKDWTFENVLLVLNAELPGLRINVSLFETSTFDPAIIMSP
jgi:molybdopterin biosynthesis enzyme MoaB